MQMYGSLYGEVQQLEVKGTQAMLDAVKLLVSQNYVVAVVSHSELWDSHNNEFYDVYLLEFTSANPEFSDVKLDWVTEDEWYALRNMRENDDDEDED